METVITYKAKDGKIFASAADCVEYEKGLDAACEYKGFDLTGIATDNLDCIYFLYVSSDVAINQFIHDSEQYDYISDGVCHCGWFVWNDHDERYERMPIDFYRTALKIVDEVGEE